ncbi:acyl-CoA carboxylase subunit epsilon [Mycobacterium sp. SMC-11]|uniref:acyl-CoA carboxylase subunit epsilon n=1 Tax=Mycobacterium sp. SMC-11 TaxID=3385969 RepID=UPI00390C613E
MSEENEATTAVEETPVAAEPLIKVLRGNPTDAEIAALVAVLGTAGGGSAESGTRDRNLWGHPVDKLRLPLFSWQRITLLERTHMRR